MAEDKLIDENAENPGPALLDRDPVILPEQRKLLAQEIKRRLE